MNTGGRLSCKNVLQFAENFLNAKKQSMDADWQLIERFFDINVSRGEMYVPQTFYPKVQKWFGTIDDRSAEDAVLRVESQTIVRIFNKWTCAQTMFNPLRSSRPMNNNFEDKTYTQVADELQVIPSHCDFCSPLSYTGVDLWGRIERENCMTASNCAKYDGLHGLIIFKDHSPVKYKKEKLIDILSVAEEWFMCANKHTPTATFPILSWNCKERAGASQSHGHAHLLLAERFHFGKWEFLRNCSERYQECNPGRNYFLDLIKCSRLLGLVKTFGTSHILVNLTPSFGYDMLVISWNYDQDFCEALDSAMTTLLNRFKSLTFNVGIHFPPLENGAVRKRLDVSSLSETLAVPNAPMPFIGYLVDRGDPSNGRFTSDVCGMMLNGSSIVARDPFEIGKIVRTSDILWR